MDSNPSDMKSPGSPMNAPIGVGDDLSAIAWVHEELRKSLDSAHKSLRRFIKDSDAVSGSDIDSVDPGVLRTARAQLHQGVGALELVGLPAAAIVLRASESAVQRAIAKPLSLTPALVGHIEKLSFGLLDFLTRLLNGKPVSPLSLFPQYRAVQEGVEAERVHPADLWSVDWRWREVAADPEATAQAPDAGAQSTIENQLLALMRGQQPFEAAARMSNLSANLGAGAADPEVRTFWRLAAGVFEAQKLGLLGFDVFSKRVASRLLAQFRILRRGDSDVSERLARDLLFFCSQSHAPAVGQHAPRLSHVRLAYGLTGNTATDYSASALGRFDPAIVQHAKKRVAAAKEAWSATAGGEMHRLSGLTEQFTLVGDSLKKLFPHGELFAAELQSAVAQTQAANAAPPAPIAMEVATSLLYIDAALDDFDFDNPEHALRIKRLAERLEAVRRHQPPQPLEVWMEELYRHVSDRQTMGSVVQELRASLSEVEKSIDAFFRKPTDHGLLSEVSPQLASMRGVLSVLGMDHATQAVARMREEIDGLVETEVDQAKIEKAGVFDRLAGNLSALGFLIDMLSVQPQMAKSLFAFDATTGILAPVMGRSAGGEPSAEEPSTPTLAAPIEQRLIEQAQLLAFSSMREDVPLQDVARDLERLSHEAQAADQPGLAAAVLKAQEALERAKKPDDVTSARGDLSEALVDFVSAAAEPAGYSIATEPAPLAPSKSIMAIGDLEHDDEMREVFLEEAREVVADAQQACADLSSAPDDIGLATTVRRAFHTLKGSSRMVGLNAFGEAAWVCEQVYNSHMADQRAIEPPLLEFTEFALGYLSGWVDEIAGHQTPTHDESHVRLAATRLARRADGAGKGRLPTFDAPALAPAQAPVAKAVSPAPAEPAPTENIPSPDVSFELDLSGLDNVPDAPASTHSVHGALDTAASAMYDPFQSTSIEETETSPRAFVDTAPSTETLDLDLGEGAPASMIESLSPSANIPSMFPGEPNLLLDLSSGEALRPATRHGDLGDTGSGVDILTASGALDGLPSDEHVKVVGNLRIGIPLFNIYLNEADELSRRLTTELAEWAMELHRPVGESPVALAHSLAGSSATVGFTALSHLARTLEHALQRSQDIGHGNDEEARLFVHAAEEIRRLLHQFAAGFLREPSAELLERLANHERTSAMRLEAITAAAELRGGAPESDSTAVPLLDLTSFDLMSLDPAEPSTVVDVPTRDARDRSDETTVVDRGLAESASTDSAMAPPELPFDAYEADLDAPDFGISELHGGPAVNDGPVIVDEPSEPVPIDDLDANARADAESQAAADEASRHVFSPEIRAIGGLGSALDKTVAPAEPAPPLEVDPAPAPAPEPTTAPAPTPTVADRPAPIVAPDEPPPAPDAHPEDPPLSSFGGLHDPLDALVLSELKPLGAAPSEIERVSVPEHETAGEDDDIDAVDAVDLELFPIFEEEALELLPKLASQLRDWVGAPQQAMHPAGCMRTLHTLKGGARLAGAMRLGEMAHRLESRIEKLAAEPAIDVAEVEELEAYGDTMQQAFEALRNRDAQAYAEAQAPAAVSPSQAPTAVTATTATEGEKVNDSSATTVSPSATESPMPASADAANDDHTSDTQLSTLVAPLPLEPDADDIHVDQPMPADDDARPASKAPSTLPPISPKPAPELPAIDWSRFAGTTAATVKPADRILTAAQSAVRVRAPVLDRLVNQAGEVSITRSRIESGVTQIKTSLGDLTENLERLRGQLRDIELQGEVQMTSRLEAAKAASQSFDPLEFDRFTRFQELTRMMAESVNDVATVQRTLQRSLESAEDELVAQARLTRELQDDLLRTRMIEFEGLSDRLYRVVRLTAKELGKQVRLDIVGGSIEVDRGVLDRMTASFEHLLRNCITHGIEKPDVRSAAGKDSTGTVVVSLTQEGNEVGVEFRDDGAGLNLPRIREKAVASGLLDPNAQVDDASLANFIFTAGFSTADTVTELAGRGVGMDVVRSDVIAIGGRIETGTEAGKGTSFKLILPLTTAVTQVVMLRCGDNTVAVPSTLVELVRRATPAEVAEAYANGVYAFGDRPLPFFWLGALLQMSARPQESTARSRTVVLIRSAQQRIAIHVDEVLGNQEVVVKNLGPQLSRLPGLAGITLLASGAASLIYNPVALATLYGDAARASTRAAFSAQPNEVAALLRAPDAPPVAPLVLVVDDSLTVRRVTQRMLVREGYRVTLAKDGLDALERLAEEVPKIVLSDIEMPRMDGFDLVRNIRADARLRELPVIMITSRIAQKHRDHAVELGVDHYLGKPYSEEDLLALVGRYARPQNDEATTLQ